MTDDLISSEDKIIILNELSYFGKQREKIFKQYEESYYKFLKTNTNIREWLIMTASDVYDISESNILSGFDYNIQECPAVHLQDIAIRNSLRRLGEWFKGDRLVQVRDHTSEGFQLNPGKVPFHNPGIILKDVEKKWWDENSIEDFYQSNKALLVRRSMFHTKPAAEGIEGIYLALNKNNYYLPYKNELNTYWRYSGRDIRRRINQFPLLYKAINAN